jgi:hypothetical protein
MKKTLLLALIAGGLASAQSTKHVLFVGNSYTYSNNLPLLLDNIANDFGDDLVYDSQTPGGMTFEGHSQSATLMDKLDDDDWDFVVLQAQSQEPSFSPTQVANDTYPYAAQICDSILANNECAEPLFFMTWGRENGDAVNCPFYPPVCTYDGMQTRLSESYTEMADLNEASISPVGEVWRDIRQQYPNYQLYSGDGSHPSLTGSYVAACTFYEIIWQKSCVGASFPTGITATEAANIQAVVNEVVSQDLHAWLQYGNIPYAYPTHFINNGEDLLFYAYAQNTTQYNWTFGDGGTMEEDSGIYTYQTAGDYTVEVTYSNDCHTYSSSFEVSPNVGIEEFWNGFELSVNQKQLSLNAETEMEGLLYIYDIQSRLVHQQALKGYQQQIDLMHLKNGNYILKLNNASGIKINLH